VAWRAEPGGAAAGVGGHRTNQASGAAMTRGRRLRSEPLTRIRNE
jgi:hypothetical protein